MKRSNNLLFVLRSLAAVQAAYIILLIFLPRLCRAQDDSPLPATGEVNWITQAHSFGIGPNLQFWDSMDCYVYCMYPQYTNHLWNWDHSGSNLEEDYENDEAGRTMPFFASVDPSLVAWNIFMAGDDNGGYTGTVADQWTTNIQAFPEVWNGTGKTNEGISFPTVKSLPIGGPQEDSSTGGGAAQIARNSAATNAAARSVLIIVDNWNCLWTNGVEQDIVASPTRLFGFYPGNHLFPAGYLCMALWDIIMMNGETNIGSAELDFNSASVVATNHQVIGGLTKNGNTLSWSVLFDREPGAWDVGDGTNGCNDAFVLMPQLATRFQWPLQIDNLPPGRNWQIKIGNSNVVTLSSAELAAGWNMFTVTNGPIWNHRKGVLDAKRDQGGYDHVTHLETHTSGDKGVGNNYDRINYYSSAGTYPGTFRGSAYITAMAPLVAGMKALDVLIHNAAQQTNYDFSATCTDCPTPVRYAPAHR
jgi:hypothetical protein